MNIMTALVLQKFKLFHGEERGQQAFQASEQFDRLLSGGDRGAQSQRRVTLTPVQGGMGNCSYFMRLFMDPTPAQQAMGSMTALNLLNGSLKVVDANERQGRAEHCHDTRGGFLACGEKIGGALNAMAGLAYGCFRVAQSHCLIAQLERGPQAASLAGRSAFFSGLIGDGLFSLSFALDIALAAKKFYDNHQWGSKLQGVCELSESSQAAFLMRQLRIDSSAYLKKMRSDPEFKERLRSAVPKELAVGLLGEEQRARCLQELRLQEDEVEDFSLLELVGLCIEEGKRALRKEAKLARRTSPDVVELIRKAGRSGLEERLQAGGSIALEAQQECKALSETTQGTLKANKKALLQQSVVSSLGLAIAVIGVLALLGGVVAPPLWLSLLFIVLAVCVDWAALSRTLSHKGGEVGKYDQLYLIFISLVLVASFAVGVGFIVGLHLGLIELIRASSIFIAGTVLTAYAWYGLKKRERAAQEAHPTVEQFKERIASLPEGTVPQEVMTLFKKLPKETRQEVQRAYATQEFKTERYRKIDASYGFGSYCLDKCFTSEAELDLFARGVKKELKAAWNVYQEEKKRETLDAALQIQALFDAIQRRDRKASLQAFDAISVDQARQRRVKESVRYVFHRQESLDALRNNL